MRAVECLVKLDSGNSVTQKCAEYLSTLIRILESLCKRPSPSRDFCCQLTQSRLDPTTNTNSDTNGTHAATPRFSTVHDFAMPSLDVGVENGNHTWDMFGTDVTQLIDPTDLEFWNMGFDPQQL